MNLLSRMTVPKIIMFISSFCSKCMYNLNLFNEVIKNNDLDVKLQINNIAEESAIFMMVQPPSVPYIVITDLQDKIIYEDKGILTSKQIEHIIQLYLNISNKVSN
jgi:hypothetical protein